MMLKEIISNAIEAKETITFRYDGVARHVEPHILGYDRKGDLALSGWQLTGTGRGWRLFHVSNTNGLATAGETFSRARPGYNRNDPAFDHILARL